jgi:hypothetical protein
MRLLKLKFGRVLNGDETFLGTHITREVVRRRPCVPVPLGI